MKRMIMLYAVCMVVNISRGQRTFLLSASSLHNPNKSSIVTSLSTILLCTPFATPNVVMNVETKALRVFVFSLKIPNMQAFCTKSHFFYAI